MNLNLDTLKDYFSTDEFKIAGGVWAGIFATDIVARTVYNAIFKPKEKTQAGQGQDNQNKKEENRERLKALVVRILVKGATGAMLYSFGQENLFLRYMAIGSLVSIIGDIADYFLPAPSAIAEEACAYACPGVVVQTV